MAHNREGKRILCLLLGEARCETRLEALLVDDGLGVLDSLLGVGVLEAAARLAVLELGPDARADAHSVALRVLCAPRTAPLLAVRVRDAAASRELRAC